MSEARSAPTVGQMVLGMRLRDLREKAGASYEQAARALHVNQTTIRRMEKAEVGLKLPYVEKLLETYGVDAEECEAFLALAETAKQPGWWHQFRDVLPDWFSLYVSLEGASVRIRAYEPHFVPGLLQTEEYARALLQIGFPTATAIELDRRVELRMERQERLNRPDAPHLWAVLDETVLRQTVGSAELMRDQIDRLIEATRRPNVTLQVMPFASGPHPGQGGPFQIFRFDVPELPDIVYAEGLVGAGYLDQRADVTAFLEVLDRMCAQATPARDTEGYLRDIRKEL